MRVLQHDHAARRCARLGRSELGPAYGTRARDARGRLLLRRDATALAVTPGRSRLLQGSEGRVEAAKAPVAIVVVPIRLDPAPHPDAASNCVVGVREDAGTNAGEEGGAERRPLLRLGRLERQSEHRGEDSEPELAPCAATRDATALGSGSELAEKLERVAQR